MIKLLFFAGAFVFANEMQGAYACSCMPSNVYNKYCESNAVLLVNPIEFTDDGVDSTVSYTAEILKVFKSKKPVTINTARILTERDGSMCGRRLTLNQKTVISAFEDENGSNFWIDLCNSIVMKYNSALEDFGDDFDCNCRLRTGYSFADRYDDKKMCPLIVYPRCRGGKTTCGLNDKGECQWRCASGSN